MFDSVKDVENLINSLQDPTSHEAFVSMFGGSENTEDELINLFDSITKKISKLSPIDQSKLFEVLQEVCLRPYPNSLKFIKNLSYYVRDQNPDFASQIINTKISQQDSYLEINTWLAYDKHDFRYASDIDSSLLNQFLGEELAKINISLPDHPPLENPDFQIFISALVGILYSYVHLFGGFKDGHFRLYELSIKVLRVSFQIISLGTAFVERPLMDKTCELFLLIQRLNDLPNEKFSPDILPECKEELRLLFHLAAISFVAPDEKLINYDRHLDLFISSWTRFFLSVPGNWSQQILSFMFAFEKLPFQAESLETGPFFFLRHFHPNHFSFFFMETEFDFFSQAFVHSRNICISLANSKIKDDLKDALLLHFQDPQVLRLIWIAVSANSDLFDLDLLKSLRDKFKSQLQSGSDLIQASYLAFCAQLTIITHEEDAEISRFVFEEVTSEKSFLLQAKVMYMFGLMNADFEIPNSSFLVLFKNNLLMNHVYFKKMLKLCSTHCDPIDLFNVLIDLFKYICLSQEFPADSPLQRVLAGMETFFKFLEQFFLSNFWLHRQVQRSA